MQPERRVHSPLAAVSSILRWTAPPSEGPPMTDSPLAAAPAEPPVFVLGLAMAGAVSAGAYTAGVVDFLLRAVRAHNRMVGTPGGPRHRVALKAMSGASAGGVTAAITACALLEGVAEEADAADAALEVDGERTTYRHALRLLHEVWVERVDLSAGPDPLLGLNDLRGKRPVRALLDAEVLDRQAGAALRSVEWDGATHDWLARDLELFLTVTTLDGVPFTAPFAEADPGAGGRVAGHPMAAHGVARHFRVTGLGTAEIDAPWLRWWGDEGVALPLPAPGAPLPIELPEAEAGPDRPWNELRLTALASGAFPGGLAARFMHLTADEVWVAPRRIAAGRPGRGGAMPLEIDWDRRPTPSHPFFRKDPDARLTAAAVDGGVVNNEPFELVRYALRPANPAADPAKPEDRPHALLPNPPSAAAADRAVLMIDPFPEGPEFRGAEPADPDRLLPKTLGALIPALLNQARFKPMELLRAVDPEVRSRFLIAPSRRAYPDEPAPPAGSRRALRLGTRGAEAIASGLLGGFGGFLHESFRRHDFILGQRNARSFLLDHFTLAAANPVFGGLYAGDAPDAERPVIHLAPELVAPVALPPWPRLPRAARETLRRKLEARVDRLADRLITEAMGGGIRGWFARNGFGFVAAGPLKGRLLASIDAALKARGQD